VNELKQWCWLVVCWGSRKPLQLPVAERVVCVFSSGCSFSNLQLVEVVAGRGSAMTRLR